MTSASTNPWTGCRNAAGNRPTDLKSQRLPQPYGALVRADHKVELHRAITACPGMGERMLAHAPRNPASGRRGTGHEAAVAHVPPTTGLIWPHIVGAKNHAILFGHERLFVTPHPISQRLGFAHVGIECVGSAFANGRENDRGDGRGIAGVGLSDMHGPRIRPSG
jgi:hypothetical protein